MKYKDMSSEIIEAIKLMYEDDEEMETDCYLYLTHLELDEDLAMRASVQAQLALEEIGRCSRCGEPITYYKYEKKYDELRNLKYDTITEWYCQNCDKESFKTENKI